MNIFKFEYFIYIYLAYKFKYKKTNIERLIIFLTCILIEYEFTITLQLTI